jgi:hypothetical protein
VIEYHEGRLLTKARLIPNEIQAEVNLNRRIQNVATKGKKRAQEIKSSQPPQSKAAFTNAMGDNRRAEVAAMHAEEAEEQRNQNIGAGKDKIIQRTSKQPPELSNGNYIGVSQVSNIADLRKKRMGK